MPCIYVHRGCTTTLLSLQQPWDVKYHRHSSRLSVIENMAIYLVEPCMENQVFLLVFHADCTLIVFTSCIFALCFEMLTHSIRWRGWFIPWFEHYSSNRTSNRIACCFEFLNYIIARCKIHTFEKKAFWKFQSRNRTSSKLFFLLLLDKWGQCKCEPIEPLD